MSRPSTLSRLQFAVPSLQSPLATLADLRRAGYPRPLAVPSSARNLAKATRTNAGYNGGDMDKGHSPLKHCGADLDKALSLQASSEKGPLPSGSRENGPSSVVFGVGILRSGICGIGRKARSIKVDDPEGAPRPLLAKRFRTGTGKGFATYWGPSLSQGHETVLMHLAEKAAGYLPGECREFDAREFVVAIGWSDSAYSRKRLWANLRDWRGAVLQTSYQTASERKDVAETILGSLERSFYGDSEGERIESERSERFSVKVAFSEGGMEVFRGVPVEVSLRKRAKLVEGLETWMYGILRSSYSGAGFCYQYLFELSGLGDSWAKASKAVKREFARDVRKALKKMVTPGTKVIWDWTPEDAGVRVWKNKPTEKQVASMIEWQPRRARARRK